MKRMLASHNLSGYRSLIVQCFDCTMFYTLSVSPPAQAEMEASGTIV